MLGRVSESARVTVMSEPLGMPAPPRAAKPGAGRQAPASNCSTKIDCPNACPLEASSRRAANRLAGVRVLERVSMVDLRSRACPGRAAVRALGQPDRTRGRAGGRFVRVARTARGRRRALGRGGSGREPGRGAGRGAGREGTAAALIRGCAGLPSRPPEGRWRPVCPPRVRRGGIGSRRCSSVVERTLGKGEVVGSNPTSGSDQHGVRFGLSRRRA